MPSSQATRSKYIKRKTCWVERIKMRMKAGYIFSIYWEKELLLVRKRTLTFPSFKHIQPAISRINTRLVDASEFRFAGFFFVSLVELGPRRCAIKKIQPVPRCGILNRRLENWICYNFEFMRLISYLFGFWFKWKFIMTVNSISVFNWENSGKICKSNNMCL